MTVRTLVATLLAGDEIAAITRIGLEHDNVLWRSGVDAAVSAILGRL
ncbi:MAG TPA: hypothetical protein VLD62_02810 [Acidimicrobiia bacterium]|nr:hypothetical protein [Acidimicrobiia bacterium]